MKKQTQKIKETLSGEKSFDVRKILIRDYRIIARRMNVLLLTALFFFAAFFALPYLLFDWSWYYYGAAFIVLIAFNITFNKQLNNLYSLIVYYVAKKRIRS